MKKCSYFFLLSYPKDPECFANIHLPSIMLLTNTDPEGKKMLFQMSEMQRSQGVPDCSLCDILPISRNPLIIFSILLLTDMTQHIFWGTKISLFGVTVYPIILLFCVEHILKLSLKSVYQFFCNVVSKYGPKKYKNQDCSLSHIRPVLQISWKYIYPFFCNVANRHGFPRKIEKEIMYARGLTEHPQKVPDCSLYQVWPILQLSWNPFMRFPVIRLTDKQTNK